jgi:hypothetical protein
MSFLEKFQRPANLRDADLGVWMLRMRFFSKAAAAVSGRVAGSLLSGGNASTSRQPEKR